MQELLIALDRRGDSWPEPNGITRTAEARAGKWCSFRRFFLIVYLFWIRMRLGPREENPARVRDGGSPRWSGETCFIWKRYIFTQGNETMHIFRQGNEHSGP